MGWKTVVIGAESVVSLSYNRMKITIGNEFHNIPLNDLDTVIFSHNKVTMTIPLLSKLIENNVNVVICDSKNDPIGVFQPFNGHSLAFKHLNRQMNWKLTRKKKLWKKIIEAKIYSERCVLHRYGIGQYEESILKEYQKTVRTDDISLREPASARLYFNALFGHGFKRDDPIAINFALNYGYKIFASYISKCIVSRGLLTQLGIHHIGEGNPFNLTYDFIEPFRAIVDSWVYENIKDAFQVTHKLESIKLLEIKVYVDKKWFRLTDAIEDIIDSYIAFMNENAEEVLCIDYSKWFRHEEE